MGIEHAAETRWHDAACNSAAEEIRNSTGCSGVSMTPAGESSSRRRLPPLPPSPWWGGGIKNFVLACDKAERDKAERAKTPCASESLHRQEGSVQVVHHGSRRQASAQMVHPDTKGVHE